MLLKRDGSIDFRVVATRILAFAGIVTVASAVGAAIALLGG